MSQRRLIGTSVTDVDLTKSDSDLTRKERIAKEQATKNYSSQGVYDEHGRQRFHGAFTGGFSAGYYNTVGSKEGFTPKSYYSSRDQRAPAIVQSITDFMDEEDMRDMDLGGRKGSRLQVTSDFARPKSTGSSNTGGNNFGVGRTEDALFVPFELIQHGPDTVGYRLLRSMGWREGRAVGPKRIALTEKEEENGGREDSKVVRFAEKNDTYGLGYSPLNFSGEPVLPKKSIEPAKKLNRMTMGGFDADDEDDMIYGTGKAKFNTELDFMDDEEEGLVLNMQPNRKSNTVKQKAPPKKTLTGLPSGLPGFVRALNPPVVIAHFPPPNVPSNFFPRHTLPGEIEPHLSHLKSETSLGATMTASMRSRLLNEEILPSTSHASPISRSNLPSNAQTSTIQKAPDFSLRSRFVSDGPVSTPIESSNLTLMQSSPLITFQQASTPVNPALLDESMKQSRYQRWIRIRRGEMKEPAEGEWNDGLSVEERSKEHEEFSKKWSGSGTQAADMMSKRFTTTKEKSALETDQMENAQKGTQLHHEAARVGAFGKLTRSVEEWTPNSLLCKRMGVKNPARVSRYGHSQSTPKSTVNVATKQSSAQLSAQSFLANKSGSWRDQMEDDANVEEPSSSAIMDEDTSMIRANLKIEDKDDNTPLPPPSRPSMDLFKSIFESDAIDEPIKSELMEVETRQSEGRNDSNPEGFNADTLVNSLFKQIAEDLKETNNPIEPPQMLSSKSNEFKPLPRRVTAPPPLPPHLSSSFKPTSSSGFIFDAPNHPLDALEGPSLPSSRSRRDDRDSDSERDKDKSKHKHHHSRKDKHRHKDHKRDKDRHKSHSKKRHRHYSDESSEDSYDSKSTKRHKN